MANSGNNKPTGPAGTGNKNGTAGNRPSTTQRNDGPKNAPPKK